MSSLGTLPRTLARVVSRLIDHRGDALIDRLGTRNLEAVERLDEMPGVLLAQSEVKPHLRCHLHAGDCLELQEGLAPPPRLFGAPGLAEHVTCRG